MWILKDFMAKFIPYNQVVTPVILQSSATECGIAALAIIFAYYKFHISLEKLREQCGSSRDGSQAATLIEVAQYYGFRAEALRVDLDFINELSMPVIAFWKFSHYVVINGVGSNKVFINDPASGAIGVSLEEFDQSFTGIIILITPTKNSVQTKKENKFFDYIKSIVKDFKIEFLFIIICLLISASMQLLVSCIHNIFIDHCVVSHQISWVSNLIIILIIFSSVMLAISVIQGWAYFKWLAKAGIMQSSNVISHMLQLPALFYSLRQKSEIVAILNRVEMTINLLCKSISSSFICLMSASVCFLFMLKINFSLLLISFSCCILSSFIFYFLSKISISFEKRHVNALSKSYSQSISIIRNIETIKSCGLIESRFKKWHDSFCEKMMSYDQVKSIHIWMDSFNRLFDFLTPLVIFYVGSLKIAEGMMSIGGLMSYYAIHVLFYKNVNNLFRTVIDGQSAYASHEKIDDILSSRKDFRFESLICYLDSSSKTSNAICCENVSFFYNKLTNPVLKNIKIEIKKGEHVAIVGSTGSGKSTLVKLMAGLYFANEGSVSLLGKNILNYSASELANIVSYVSQDATLFSGNLIDNLTLWNHAIDIKKIIQAIKIACLDDFVSKIGFYAKINEGGSNFSGGEKQRIEIARALIQDTPIMIFDESTSALDGVTESKIINNLKYTDKTIVFVAHRMSSITHCDQIIVMNNNQIIEQGRHDDLLNLRGCYYDLFNENGCVKNE